MTHLLTLDESWHLWRDDAHSPWFNMAADEILLKRMTQLSKPVLRVYTWDRPSVSIGFAQTWGITPPRYTAVRRLTGGGVVFHDVDLTYTLVFPAGHPLAELPRETSYEYIHQAIAHQLALHGRTAGLLSNAEKPDDHAKMQCFVSPSRFDVMENGHKSAGAAQRRTLEGVLHQGSVMHAVTNGDIPKLAQWIESAFAMLFNVRYEPWRPTEIDLNEMEALAINKYQSDNWSLKRRHQS